MPFVAIIGRNGEVPGVDSRDSDSARELLYEWINEQIDRKNEHVRSARRVGQ